MARPGFRALPWLLATALSGGALLLPAPAAACSYGAVLVEASYPSRGAADVPTNAVLFVYGSALTQELPLPRVGGAILTRELQLQRADGEIIPIEVRAAEPSGFDLIPLRELDPLQQYALRMLSPPPDYNEVVLDFTTGSGPAAVPEVLSAPAVDLTVLRYGAGTCGIQSGLCLETSSAPATTIEVRVGTEVLPDGAGAPFPRYRIYGGELRESDCVEVRGRDVRGRRSAPTTLCGTEISRVELKPGFDVVYTCDNYSEYLQEPAPTAGGVSAPTVAMPRPSDAQGSPVQADGVDPRDVTFAAANSDAGSASGCTLARGDAGAPTVGVLGLGLLLGLCWRRRRA
jgi:hypothetical protein